MRNPLSKDSGFFYWLVQQVSLRCLEPITRPVFLSAGMGAVIQRRHLHVLRLGTSLGVPAHRPGRADGLGWRMPAPPYHPLRRPWLVARDLLFAAKGVLAVTGGLFVGPSAIAQDGAPAPLGGFSAQLGNGHHASRVGLSWETPPWWGWAGGARQGRWTAVTEWGAARWAAHSDLLPSSVWQVSVTPLVRYWTASQPGLFFEAGIGASVFRHTHFADDAISTAFQFGDHLGMGYQTATQHRISLRLSHYSNAGIKSPNPGLTVLQLSYTYLP